MAFANGVSLETLESNPAALEALLQQVFVPDTERIKAAEEVVKRFTKRPGSIKALMMQMQSSQSPQARQLAAMLLRKKIMNHWMAFSPEDKEEIKRTLLAALGAEPERVVRHSMAALAAKLAKALFTAPEPPENSAAAPAAAAAEAKGWPELLQMIAVSAQHPSEAARELSFVLLLELTETTGDSLQQHFAALRDIFATALRDPAVRVQTAALRALAALLTYLSQEEGALQFREVIPLALAGARACMLRQEDQAVSDMLDALGEMVASSQPLLQPFVGEVVPFLLEAVANEELEMGTRASAAHLLGLLAEHKPKALAKSGLVPAYVQAMVRLIASHKGSAANALFVVAASEDQEDDDSDDDDEDYDGPSPQGMAQSCLDQLALGLPTKHVFPPCAEVAAQCSASPDPHYRKAAAAVMGVIAEGCCDSVRDNLKDIMPMVLQSAGDAEPLVRECGCFCLGQFAEHVQPEILEYHEQILPVAFALLDDESDKVKGIACYVIEQFTENLAPESLKPYLDALVRRLVQMMQGTKPGVAQMAVAAMAATAVAAEDAFLPYLDSVVQLVGQMLSLTEEKLLPLRGRALECMGHMAIAVKAEHFRPYVEACMICAVQNVKMDDIDLQDYSYNFFANMARALGSGMAPYVPELIVHLLGEVGSADASPLEALGADAAAADGEGGLSGFAHDEDEDSDDEGGMYLNIRTAELDKKKAAIVAVGALAEYVPEAFEPYLEATYKTLNEKLDFWHDDIRVEACDALRNLVTASANAKKAPEPPTRQPGEAAVAVAAAPLPPQTAELARAVMQAMIKVMKEDTEREVVSHACEAVQGVVARLGATVAAEHIAALGPAVADIFQEKAQCQVLDASDAEDEPDEDDEGRLPNQQVLEAAADLTGELAKALGPRYIAVFDALLPSLLPFARGQRTSQERAMAVGAFAEVADAMGHPAAAKYLPELLPVVRLALTDGDLAVQRNAAYCMGALAAAAGTDAAPQVIGILQALAPLFHMRNETKPGAAGVVDNAAAAVARLIMACTESVPLAQVLPLFVSALPLRSDMSENPSIYRCVLGLLAARQADALAQLPALAGVFAAALGESSGVQDDLKVDIVTLLRQLAADPSTEPLLVAATGALPPEQRDQLVRHIAQQ